METVSTQFYLLGILSTLTFIFLTATVAGIIKVFKLDSKIRNLTSNLEDVDRDIRAQVRYDFDTLNRRIDNCENEFHNMVNLTRDEHCRDLDKVYVYVDESISDLNKMISGIPESAKNHKKTKKDS